MSDWYVSSAAWTAIAQFAASTAYSVGQIVRPLTAPSSSAQHAYRCTTAGTSGAEPGWNTTNNATTTSGGATFTNVAGQGIYGWTAAAGNTLSLDNSASSGGRISGGDRVFVSSDHVQTVSNCAFGTAAGFTLVQVISVNSAGSVPPVSADQTSGAQFNNGTSQFILQSPVDTYFQGVSFSCGEFTVNNGSGKKVYLRNCNISCASGGRVDFSSCGTLIMDNTTFTPGATNVYLGASSNASGDLIWTNTPSALLGTVPTNLIQTGGSGGGVYTFRGVDLSALNTTLYNANNSAFVKVLLDSCRISSSLVRFGATYNCASDEVELVNCYDGTTANISERHTPAGDLTTDRSTTMVGGAQDDVGLFAHKLISSSRADMLALTLDSFWMDAENTFIGALRTATVEIISSSSLNNTDLSLSLEYLGTSGSSLAAFATSLPSALTLAAALPSSTATWNNPPPPTWSTVDIVNASLSNGNLTATATANPGGVRSPVGLSAGKYYIEYTMTTFWDPGFALASVSLTAGGSTNMILCTPTSGVLINGSSPGSLGILGGGTILGYAIDTAAQLVWIRVAPAGQWNASGTANPATGVGGWSFSSIVGTLYPYANNGAFPGAFTANFGGSAFSGAVPAGFTSGLPGAVKQQLKATFTPQQAGRLRGLVRLGKPSTTVWINPQITVS